MPPELWGHIISIKNSKKTEENMCCLQAIYKNIPILVVGVGAKVVTDGVGVADGVVVAAVQVRKLK